MHNFIIIKFEHEGQTVRSAIQAMMYKYVEMGIGLRRGLAKIVDYKGCLGNAILPLGFWLICSIMCWCMLAIGNDWLFTPPTFHLKANVASTKNY